MSDDPAQDVANEIAQDLHRSVAAMELALGGLRRRVDEITSRPTVPENPDPLISVGAGPPETTRAHGAIRQSELVAQAARGGGVEALLGQQWIVATFTRWELDYRPRFAAAAGLPVDHVLCDVFGDLRHLRNDIVHHGGIATKANAGRCKVLTRFTEGETIRMTAADYLTIQDNVIIYRPLS